METKKNDEDLLEKLRSLTEENTRLKKINNCLMDRVEKGTSLNGKTAFDLFQKNATLSTEVQKRTSELKDVLKTLEAERNKLAHIVETLPGLLLFSDLELEQIEHIGTKSYVDSFAVLKNKSIRRNMLDKIQRYAINLNDSESNVVIFETTLNDEQFAFLCTVTKDVSRYVIYVQDYTDRYRQEKLIQQQETSIAQSSKLAAIGEIAAGIAHEINNPLAIITASMSVIEKKLRNDKYQSDFIVEVLNDVRITINRMSKIISGMRTLTRSSADPLDMQSYNLEELVSDVLALCAPKLSTSSISLEYTYDKDQRIYCDKVLFSQVLINLICNSIDAVEDCEEKFIRIGYNSDDNWDYVTIEDSGPGIPEQIREQIFNPFFTTKKVGKGKGLGLSISRRIMVTQNGQIQYDVNSALSRFILKLPKELQKLTSESAR